MSNKEIYGGKDDLTLEEGRFLIALSREAIAKYLSENKVIQQTANTPQKLLDKRGVFVTLSNHASDELRGCIGFPEPAERLVKATIIAAIEAATGDPRFHSVTLEEMDKDLIVEVSVLTTPKAVRAEPRQLPEAVSIGIDGLIIEKGLHRGLLLPQVAIEWGWDGAEFLTNCCLKAGLPPDEWLTGDVKVFKFQAAVFKETAPKGSVKRLM